MCLVTANTADRGQGRRAWGGGAEEEEEEGGVTGQAAALGGRRSGFAQETRTSQGEQGNQGSCGRSQ